MRQCKACKTVLRDYESGCPRWCEAGIDEGDAILHGREYILPISKEAFEEINRALTLPYNQPAPPSSATGIVHENNRLQPTIETITNTDGSLSWKVYLPGGSNVLMRSGDLLDLKRDSNEWTYLRAWNSRLLLYRWSKYQGIHYIESVA